MDWIRALADSIETTYNINIESIRLPLHCIGDTIVIVNVPFTLVSENGYGAVLEKVVENGENNTREVAVWTLSTMLQILPC